LFVPASSESNCIPRFVRKTGDFFICVYSHPENCGIPIVSKDQRQLLLYLIYLNGNEGTSTGTSHRNNSSFRMKKNSRHQIATGHLPLRTNTYLAKTILRISVKAFTVLLTGVASIRVKYTPLGIFAAFQVNALNPGGCMPSTSVATS
jgi:hypothetical protein